MSHQERRKMIKEVVEELVSEFGIKQLIVA